MWHAAPGVKVAEGMEFILPVRDALERTLNKWTAIMKSGSSEERHAWCQETYKLVDETMANHSFVDVDPHKWAMGEVQTETDWLCKNWEASAGMSAAERQAQYQSHLDAMKEVLDMYVEKLECLPGDVACNQGTVVGMKPSCMCECKVGWVGESCHERSPDWIAAGMHVSGAPAPYADANGLYQRDGDFNGKPVWRLMSNTQYSVGQWSDGDWCVMQNNRFLYYTGAYRGSSEPPAEWRSGTVRVAVQYDVTAEVEVAGSNSGADGIYIRDGAFNSRPRWLKQGDGSYSFGMWSDGDWAVIHQNHWIFYTKQNQWMQAPPASWTYSGVTVKVLYTDKYTNTLLKNSSEPGVQRVTPASRTAPAPTNATASPEVSQNSSAVPKALLRGDARQAPAPVNATAPSALPDAAPTAEVKEPLSERMANAAGHLLTAIPEVAAANATAEEAVSKRLMRLTREVDSAAPQAPQAPQAPEEPLSKRLLRVASQAGLVRAEPNATEPNASAAAPVPPNASEEPLSARMKRALAAPTQPNATPPQSNAAEEPLSVRMMRAGAAAPVAMSVVTPEQANATEEPLSARMRAGAAPAAAVQPNVTEEPLSARMMRAGAAPAAPAQQNAAVVPAAVEPSNTSGAPPSAPMRLLNAASAPEAPDLNSTKIELYHYTPAL